MNDKQRYANQDKAEILAQLKKDMINAQNYAATAMEASQRAKTAAIDAAAKFSAKQDLYMGFLSENY